MSSISNQYQIGIDVGGSHISGALVKTSETNNSNESIIHKSLDSNADAVSIVQTLCSVITELAIETQESLSVGIAMPGPFNYVQGISEIHGVGGKFSNLFGLNMAEALKTFSLLPKDSEVHFVNDAHCFAVGACHHFKAESGNVICLTLGTGFGSAFIQDGKLIEQHDNIPSAGAFYCERFKDSIADDYFSTRWFLNTYQAETGKTISSVKELALLAAHDAEARNIFIQFGENLANFLHPWLAKFECNILIIGGNIAKAWNLFGEGFQNTLSNLYNNTEVLIAGETETHIITGAAILAKEKTIHNKQMNSQSLRKTSQPLLPVQKTSNGQTEYDIFPAFELSNQKIERGFTSLAKSMGFQKTVIIDGYSGVLWNHFRAQLHAALVAEGIKPLWYDITSCLKPEDVIDEMIAENMNGNDPVFGKRYTGNLIDFFDINKLSLLQQDTSADMCILYGTGASLANWDGLLIYLDVPKNEIQYRMRAKSITNLGTTKTTENTQSYKRFYFVDWPVLNIHKQQLLPSMDIIVDEQRIDDITWMAGNDFRSALNQMLQQAIRARPWFEAGVWGGQWMKKKLTGLRQDEVNYAWSFELITPENGIVLENNNTLLEVSFDFLLYYNKVSLLGKAAERFGTEFPIRFDFLDTFDGGNLSIQCHPRTNYIKEKFGENFTQDETYYILDCADDAKVYLGFQDDIEPSKFKSALINAQKNNEEIKVEEYVQSFTAQKHDLFLIPNGTVHASGKNNLVLEISSTPYIFTFKMYDWLRLDLNGQPRPINIEHAFNNLYFDRKGDYVSSNLISHPKVIKEWNEGRVVKLPTHPEHFYTVDRYEFTNDTTIKTNGQCHCCMLVEGEEIEVIVNGKTTVFKYAETFIIPASVQEYKVLNQKGGKAYLLVAYVKNESCTSNQN
ncbi:ROK family protein [Chitinophagaceae bacterium LB-8]|uniref:ROK family protein n=1 Tax=Paraflavisolibacter caeni TaxID=2982496 RepID=A0A9X2XNP9_9BACT|nr:ROK family protein [Paraflavisolibacter caeni]MCU7548804.1 ROK family protein [Paraflavisolibacter caeni]